MKVIAAILISFCALAWAETKFPVSILEKGTFVHETVTITDDGLHVFHVPAHHDLEEAIVYIDYENDALVEVLPNMKKCRVMRPDLNMPDLQTEKDGLKFYASMILSSESANTQKIAIVEEPEPLSDMSFLREELREACQGFPAYMTRKVDVTHKKDEYFLVKASMATHERARRSTDYFICPMAKFFQKCKVSGPGDACYYFVLCGGVEGISQSCLKHLRHTSTLCKPCCTADNSPKSGQLMHCDLLKL